MLHTELDCVSHIFETTILVIFPHIDPAEDGLGPVAVSRQSTRCHSCSKKTGQVGWVVHFPASWSSIHNCIFCESVSYLAP
jgi:hypothetical protein